MENMISNFRQSELSQLFNNTLTENGDFSHKNHTNKLVDILFKCEYYTKNPSALHIGNSNIEKLFSMFIRDPRFGLGYKTVGRRLMALSGVTPENVVKAGSFKDFRECQDFFRNMFDIWQGFLYQEISNGNELAKKWVPRYSSKNLMLARRLAKAWGMNKQQYGHFVKCNTTENKLSRHETEQINFEHVPSLAMLKYYKRFKDGEDTAKRFAEYLESVKKGDAKFNVAVTTFIRSRSRTILTPTCSSIRLKKSAEVGFLSWIHPEVCGIATIPSVRLWLSATTLQSAAHIALIRYCRSRAVRS